MNVVFILFSFLFLSATLLYMCIVPQPRPYFLDGIAAAALCRTVQVRPDATSAAVPQGAVGREGRVVRLVRRQDFRQEGVLRALRVVCQFRRQFGCPVY